MVNLQAGIAKATITPPGVVPMAGYITRSNESLGVHDPLWARCFLFDSGRAQVALVVLDLVGIHERWAAEVQRRVAAAAGVAPEMVVVTCTHTHSGPGGLEVPPAASPVQERVAEVVLAGAEKAAAQAARTLTPAVMGVATSSVHGVASNRNWPQQHVDQTLWSLVIRDARGSVRGVLANFPCHSTVLGGDNRLLSGDLFGAAAMTTERALSNGAVVALTVGAAGDISTRFTRQAQDFSEVDRIGRILTSVLMKLIEAATPSNDASVALRWRHCWLPYKAIPSMEAAQRMIDNLRVELTALLGRRTTAPGPLRVARTRVEGAERLLSMAQSGMQAAGGTEAQLCGVRLGPGILIGIPGEPFSTVGQVVRNQATPPLQSTVLSLANGYLGYFPDEDAVRLGWYEALTTPFDHIATMSLTEAAAALVGEMEEEDDVRTP